MAKSKGCRILVLGGSKGGCGRSTLTRNLLVAARQAGLKAVGVDLDAQRTLGKWAARRTETRSQLPQIVDVEVIAASADEWDAVRPKLATYQLAIVDTAPGVEHEMARMVAICRDAAYVLVPCSPSTDDLESVVPWWTSLAAGGAHGAFVLNRANRRTRAFAASRSALLRHGALVPVEIPLLEGIAAPFSSGLTVMDYDKAAGADVIADLWRHTRREIGL